MDNNCYFANANFSMVLNGSNGEITGTKLYSLNGFDTSGNINCSGDIVCKNIDISGNLLIGDNSGGFIWNQIAQNGYNISENLYLTGSAFINMNTGYLNFSQSSQGQMVSKSLWLTDALNVNLAFVVDMSGNTRCNNLICQNMHTADIDCHGNIGCLQNITANTITCNNGLTVGFQSTYSDTSGQTIYMPASMGNLMIGDLSGGYIWNKEARDAIDLSGNPHANDSAFINMHYGDLNFENARIGRIMGKALYAKEDIYVNSSFHVDTSGNVNCRNIDANGFQVGTYSLNNGLEKSYVSILSDTRFTIPVGEAVATNGDSINASNLNTDSASSILNSHFTGTNETPINPIPIGTMWIETHPMEDVDHKPVLYVYLTGPNNVNSGWYGLQLDKINNPPVDDSSGSGGDGQFGGNG